MKIWLRNKWYTIENDILVVKLTDKDRENIANMKPGCDLYCEYDEKMFETKLIIKLLKNLKGEDK